MTEDREKFLRLFSMLEWRGEAANYEIEDMRRGVVELLAALTQEQERVRVLEKQITRAKSLLRQHGLIE